MGFFKKGREKEVVGMIMDLLNKVHECIEETEKAITHYLNENIAEAKTCALKTDHIETEADHIRRSIVDALFKGAFLPIFRVEVHNFVEKMDLIANNAEICCDFFLGQRPMVPVNLKERFLKIIHDTLPMSRFLKEATEDFFTRRDHEFIRERITQIGIAESAIDDDEWKLTRDLFTSADLSLAEKMHLRRCLERLTSISDQIEDTSDWLEVLLISTKV